MTDILHHWKEIGESFGVSADAARHLHKTRGLPIFRLGRRVAASRVKVMTWLKEQEALGTPGAGK